MKIIFRVLMLMLAAALVACGGGGGSSGGNPNQPFLTTTAGTEIILPVNATRDYQISGGVPPYRVVNPNEKVAIGQISGNTLTIGTLLVGVVKLDVLDHSGALVSINVKSGSSVPLYTTAPGALTVGVGASVARTFWIGGGSPGYTVEGGNSNVALVQMLSDTQWRVTGISKGSTTVKIRDASGVEVSIALEVGSPELRISPTDLTMPVGLEAVAKLSGGQPPYRVAGGIPAAITATIVGDELHIKGSLASTLDISVMDAAGQIVKVKVEINTTTTSIRLSPGAVVISENDTQPIQFSIFGAVGATCVFTSDPSFLQPTTPGCLNRSGVTLDTGTRGSRCVNGDMVVGLTVVDENRSVGTAKVTIADNGSCGNLTVLPATAQVRVGATMQLAIAGGSGSFVVSSDNPSVATATASGLVVVVTGGTLTGNAVITIRDQSDTSKVVTLPVTVFADTNPPVPVLTTTPQTLTLALGAAADVLVNGGSGKFDVATSNNQIATAVLKGNVLSVTAGAISGTARITIRDQVDSSRAATVTVTVSNGAGLGLAASPSSLSLPFSTAADVLLSGGSGKYEVAVANSGIATAKLTGNILQITAGATAGTTTVTVRDQADLSKTVVINITVSSGTVGVLTAAPSSFIIQSGAARDVLLSGGSGKYDVAESNSAVAKASLIGNKLTVTAGTSTGSATVTVRDQADATQVVVVYVTVTTGPAPVRPMTASPSSATGSVQETLQFLLQNGTAPYSIVVSNPGVASVTLPVVDNQVVVQLKQAGAATLVVTDANGQTLNIQVTATQTQQASLRFAPSAFEIGEDSLLPVTLTVFGGTGPYRAVTSDLTLSDVAVRTNPTTGLTEFTVGLGSRNNRCINPFTPSTTTDVINPATGVTTTIQVNGDYIPRGSFDVILTVIDTGGSFATSTMTIRDNGTGARNPVIAGAPTEICPGFTGFSTTAGPNNSTIQVLLGSGRVFSIFGGAAPYTVTSSNSAVAKAELLSQAGWSVSGLTVGSAVVTIRDSASQTLTINVSVNP